MKKQRNLDDPRRGSGRHKNALASIIIMFAMTSTTLCSRVAAPAKLNKRAERKTVARAAMTTADAASRRETLGLMAVRFLRILFALLRELGSFSLVGLIGLANHDPSFRVGLDSPKRGSRTSLDGRSRAHRGVRRRRLPFHGVPSHGENFNAYTNRRGCARASRRVPRLAFKLSRGSLLAGIADRSSIDSNPFRHRLRATPFPRQNPRDIHERKTDFKSASSRTLQAGAALTITRPANAAYGDSANVFGSVSNPTGACERCETTRV